MIVLLRLLTILRVFLRYRLDQILPTEQLSFGMRLLLLPCKLFPTPSLNRGERLRRAFEDLGPIFIKFGQLLSTRPDLIPDDIVRELNHLQDNVKPFDANQFRALVELARWVRRSKIFFWSTNRSRWHQRRLRRCMVRC